MEATAQSVEDYLIEGLSFKLKPGASYITNRRSVTFFPHGGNEYSPSGVKVIKLMLTGDQWLDPSTLRLSYDLVNTATNANYNLYTTSGPWAFFRRLRIICGGQIVEDIDYYARVHEMMHMTLPSNVRDNDDVEGFKNGLQSTSATIAQLSPLVGLPGNASQTAIMRLLSGLLTQEKFLPIRYCPITIELELVNNFTDAVISQGVSIPDPAGGATPVVLGGTNSSQSWKMNNIQLKCDLCTLDNALDNEYSQHLLSGKSLPISYSTYVSQLAAIGQSNQNISLTITRAFTRLKSAFITFTNTSNTGAQGGPTNPLKLEYNNFYHPMANVANRAYDSNNEMELQLQIGSKLYPEYPCRSLQEAFYQLRKCMGLHSSTWHSMDISSAEYRNSKFIFAIDTEKTLAAGWTGINTKAGDLTVLKAKCLGTTATNYPSACYVVLHSNLKHQRYGCRSH